MIVRHRPDGSAVMITQNDHAKLAGLFAAHWGNAQFARPHPRNSMLRAAQYHDGGWLRYETDPLLDPVTRRSPTYHQVPNDAPQLAAYQWAIDMLTDVDSYSGLIISRHRTGLWKSRYGAIMEPAPGPPRSLGDEIRSFIARNEERQQAIAAGFDSAEIAVNYNLLQVWDLMSLYVCSNDTLWEHVIAPVPTTYRGNTGIALRLTPVAAATPATIVVDPFPFDRAPLEAAVVYRHLPPSALSDDDAFKAAYFGAPPEIAHFNFVAAP
ncbi:MAG: DUF3891 family protein [Hyphomicrobiales bacterium]|nr:DUF3891 family protein [Hyphomicrobiales bacterium]